MKKKNYLKFLILLGLCLIISGCCPYYYLPIINPPTLPAFKVPPKIRVALVLGSGGVRGMVHVGAIEEFEKAGIKFDLIVGCSAGSIVGALYADCPNADWVKNAVCKLKTHSILDIDIWRCRFGLSQGRAMRRVLNNNLSARTFDQLQIPLVVVATDLNSGELIPIGSGDLVKAVQASAAIPLIFVPIEMHGRTLVDGGVVNPVPVCVARDLGADVVIAVDLRELLPKTFPTNLFGIANRSTEIAFLWQNEVCCRQADVVIRPTLCDVGTFNARQMSALYEAGKIAARDAIPKIKEILMQLPHDTEENGLQRNILLSPYAPDEA